MKEPTQNYLKQRLDYDPETGVFMWKPYLGSNLTREQKIFNSLYSGRRAGSEAAHGYREISVLGKQWKEHRLAWLYVTGEWPKDQIDHINHIRDDNKFKNFREATCVENGKNASRRKTNKSGVTGVSWDAKNKRWKVSIQSNNKYHFLGRFKGMQDAIRARRKAEARHGFHENHGKPLGALA